MVRHLRWFLFGLALLGFASIPLTEAMQTRADAPASVASPPVPAASTTPKRTVTSLAIGGDTHGELATTDLRSDDGKPFDRWILDCASTGVLTVSVISTEFDAFAELRKPDGALVGKDDDSAGMSNPRLLVECAAGVSYQVVVTVFASGGAMGRYIVRVMEGES
jgi:hypothetical protein